MFKNISLRLKLVLAFICIAALMVIVCVYQISSMQQFSNRLDTIANQDLSRINALQDVQTASVELASRTTEYQQSIITKAADQTNAHDVLVAQADDLQHTLQVYETLVGAQSTDNVSGNANELVAFARTITTAKQPLSSAEQVQFSKTSSDLSQAINVAFSAQRRMIQEKSVETIKLNDDRQFTIGMMAILFTFIAGVMGVLMASWIGRSLAILGGSAERIANGDFSQALDSTSHDEIGQVRMTFNHMAQRLRDSYQRLALEQQRDEAILKGMGEGVIAVDGEGKIVIINKVAGELLELGDETEVLQKPIQDAYPLYHATAHKDTRLPGDRRPSYMALKTGQAVEDVYLFHAKSGEKRQINIAANPFKLDGKVVGVVTILRDVTKEKEIDRMKTEFISLASHQLRTPLSAIKWFSEMLLNGDAGKLKPEQLEFTKSISDSTERMIALVSSLLNISRIESGRIMIVPEPTDLRELVGGIVDDLKAKTEEKQQNLIISVHEGLPKINLDPRLIGQVYLNLLTNAIKYTPKGGEISVFISKKDDMIVSQVTDNGYGIPKVQQARMFEKFFRASNAVKVETDGTGLGLYLIKAVVESSGGKIWFESEENKGSTFWFTIPLSGMKPKEGEVTLDV